MRGSSLQIWLLLPAEPNFIPPYPQSESCFPEEMPHTHTHKSPLHCYTSSCKPQNTHTHTHTNTHIRNRSWRAGWSASCFLSKSLILTPQKEHRGIVTYLKTTALQFPLWKNTAFVCSMCLSGLLRGWSAWALVQTESLFFGKMRIWAGKATNY